MGIDGFYGLDFYEFCMLKGCVGYNKTHKQTTLFRCKGGEALKGHITTQSQTGSR